MCPSPPSILTPISTNPITLQVPFQNESQSHFVAFVTFCSNPYLNQPKHPASQLRNSSSFAPFCSNSYLRQPKHPASQPPNSSSLRSLLFKFVFAPAKASRIPTSKFIFLRFLRSLLFKSVFEPNRIPALPQQLRLHSFVHPLQFPSVQIQFEPHTHQASTSRACNQSPTRLQ